MLNNIFVGLGIGGVILLILAIFVAGPFLSIIAVNQLFGTTIGFTFWNWLATFWLHLVVASATKSNVASKSS
jgi:hypothetical protein